VKETIGYPRMPPGTVVFYVKPEQGSALNVRVEIFRNLTTMRAFCKLRDRQFKQWEKRSKPRSFKRTIGQCEGSRWYYTSNSRIVPTFAIIRLAKGYTATSTVTHEAFHALLRFAQRRRIPFIRTGGKDVNEERFAHALDTMVESIARGLKRRKLI
jgi:hypothetical protein